MKIESEYIASLHPTVREVLDKSDDERIEFLYDDKWIPYPAANVILERMERLLKLPKKLRMPGMLIVGETNNGKSSIAEYFCRIHTPIDQEEAIQYPVINVLAPDGPDLNGLYGEILYQMMAPYPSSARTAKKEELVRYYFDRLGVRMLIIDEIHHLLSGPIVKQKQFMNGVKNLSNHLRIPIVLAGTKDALRATSTDPQISNRFTPVFLPKWKVDQDYVSLLASIETLLPLKKPSGLASNKQIALEIFNRTGGNIGEVLNLIYLAAEFAIRSGSERIAMDEIKGCGYVPSSDK